MSVALRKAAQEVVDRWTAPSLANAMSFDDAVKGLAAALAEADSVTPGFDHLVALLEADRLDQKRDPMWRYGVRHALTLVRAYGMTDCSEADRRVRVTQAVARIWLEAIMASDALRPTGMSHPLAMVMAALDGEADPRQLGISEEDEPKFRALVSRTAPAR